MTALTKALVAGAAAAGVALITACGGGNVAQYASTLTTPVTCTASHGLGLIIGAHRDVPAPQLSAIVQCELQDAIKNGQPVFLVVADGQPSVRMLSLVPVIGGTPAGQVARVDANLATVRARVSEARPGNAGIDDLAALAVASDEARSVGVPHATLVLADSGLDDRGALNFTRSGMLAAQPKDVVGQLRKNGEQPHLGGMSVILSGIGYVAAPQTTLPVNLRTNLTSIWQAVIASSGGTVTAVDPNPVSGPAVRTVYAVNRVPISAQVPVRPGPNKTIVFNAESPVSFVANSPQFLDPAAAEKALRPIGQWLAADPRRRATITGTTMNYGSYAGQVQLSLARARAAEAVICAAGASPDQITVRGVGSHFPQYKRPDKAADGSPLPTAALANRSVRITLYGPPA
jgi:outer membrane protein OmpA-like peptidoglycan-associated protein